MTTVYSWPENAATASSVADGDFVAIYPAAGGGPQILPASVLQADAPTPVNVTAGVTTLALTQAAHGGRTVTLNNTGPIAITLPASAGTGAKYKLVVQVSATATSSTVKVANSTDIMQGITLGTSTNAGGFATTATSDTVSINGAGTGGGIGTIYEFEDVKAGFWSVKGRDTIAVTQTPYSATV